VQSVASVTVYRSITVHALKESDELSTLGSVDRPPEDKKLNGRGHTHTVKVRYQGKSVGRCECTFLVFL